MFLAKYSGAGALQWVQNYGQSSRICRGRRLAVDAAGDVVVMGLAVGSLSLGGDALPARGLEGVFLAKYVGGTGRHLWSKTFGGTGWNMAKGLAVDASNRIFMAGNLSSGTDIGFGSLLQAGVSYSGPFVASVSPDGTPSWVNFVRATITMNGAAARADGRIFIAGQVSGTADLGSVSVTAPTSADMLLLECAP
jgi:hypothetical protein